MKKALREDLKTINNNRKKKRPKIWGTENTKIDSSPCPSVAGQDGTGWLGVHFLLQKVDEFNQKKKKKWT